MIYTTGQKPGKGYYACRKCGQVTYLESDDRVLPPCPKCKGTHWDKLS